MRFSEGAWTDRLTLGSQATPGSHSSKADGFARFALSPQTLSRRADGAWSPMDCGSLDSGQGRAPPVSRFHGSDMEISKNLGVEGGECRSVVR